MDKTEAAALLTQAANALSDAADAVSDDESEDGPYRRIRAIQDSVDELVNELTPED